MSTLNEITLDPNRIIDRLAQRIAELEIEVAKQAAMIQVLAATPTEKPAEPDPTS